MMKCTSTTWEAVKYHEMSCFCKGVTPPPPPPALTPSFDEFYGFWGWGRFHEKKLLFFWILSK